MHSILVVNAKGGCGKSTLAMNIASYYACWGMRVALADFDPKGATYHWLRKRPKSLPPIRLVEGWRQGQTIPDDAECCVMDVPAGVQGEILASYLAQADSIVIPILPSPLDIRAGGFFVYELLRDHAALIHAKRVAIVANRVRQNTLVFKSLKSFLEQLNIPFLATIRDTQNYIRAADNGLGIFDMPPRLVERDIHDWQPVVKWLNEFDHAGG